MSKRNCEWEGDSIEAAPSVIVVAAFRRKATTTGAITPVAPGPKRIFGRSESHKPERSRVAPRRPAAICCCCCGPRPWFCAGSRVVPRFGPRGLQGCFCFRGFGAKGGAMIDHSRFAYTGSATIPSAAAPARIGSRRNSDLFSSNCLTR